MSNTFYVVTLGGKKQEAALVAVGYSLEHASEFGEYSLEVPYVVLSSAKDTAALLRGTEIHTIHKQLFGTGMGNDTKTGLANKLFPKMQDWYQEMVDGSGDGLEKKGIVDLDIWALGRVLEAAQVEAAQVEATQVEATQVEATQVEATQVEAAQVEATQVEATQVEATQVEATITSMSSCEVTYGYDFTRYAPSAAADKTSGAKKPRTPKEKKERRPSVKQRIRGMLVKGYRVRPSDFPDNAFNTVKSQANYLRYPSLCGDGGPINVQQGTDAQGVFWYLPDTAHRGGE